MNIDDLRYEVNIITKIFLSVKYYTDDFKYFNSTKYQIPLIYKSYHFFIERILHSISVSIIIDLSKLYNKSEAYSIPHLCNKLIENYSKQEYYKYIPLNSFCLLSDEINAICTSELMKKIIITRNKYYAHLDRNKPIIDLIKFNNSEIDDLLTKTEIFLKAIELNFFGVSQDYDLTKEELGHNIFEKLKDWEFYRKKFGLL